MDPANRAPTLNIRKSVTTLGRIDPLKKVFRVIFDSLPSAARGHVVGFLGEFIGTISFLIFAFAGGQTGAASSNKKEDQGDDVATAPSDGFSPSLLLYIALSAGFSLAVNAWIFFRVSGGLFNPVISIGMALIGAITWARCAILVVAQTLGAIIASYVVFALFNGGLNVATTLGGGTSPGQGVVIEMLLTALVTFTVFMLAAEKHDANFVAPVGIGLSLFVAELVGVFWTGGSLNPVRSLAPCIVNRSFTEYHWIYWVGPFAGVLLAVVLYKLIKALEYETLQEEDVDDRSLLMHNCHQRRPSSVVALASIHSDGPVQVRRVSRDKDTATTLQIRSSQAESKREDKNDKDASSEYVLNNATLTLLSNSTNNKGNDGPRVGSLEFERKKMRRRGHSSSWFRLSDRPDEENILLL